MIRKTLKEITEMIQVENDLSVFHDNEINGVSIDSRKIQPGHLFVPFKGENFDGHQFVEAAIKQGAGAALWQKDIPNPPIHLPILIVEDTLIALQELARSYRHMLGVRIVGVTGSNGKTTTKDMTANLLSVQYKVQKTEGNFNNEIGLPLTILDLDKDTEIAVLEMGMSSRGEIDFLTRLAEPEAAIITNIGESHLLDLGSREGIAEAKLEIIHGLKEKGVITYYGDEPLLHDRLSDYEGNIQIKTFGRSGKNDIFPVDIKQNDTGSTFKTNVTDIEFKLPVLGTHNVLNALAAMTVASHFGVPFERMNEGFSELKLTNMRTELLQGKKGEKIINDAYNASPTSMHAAIELLSHLPGYKNKILVLGDMLELGPQEEEFHLKMGESIDPQKIDFVFTFGKLGELIAEGAKTKLPSDRVFAFTEKQALIEKLEKIVNEETIVLVKASRGMKLEEVVTALQ
ncbi:UDP-N-acetylmuramoyl-tripeptide--D-alanyl-D-alanine ligase [Bacillus sp. S/N-304-OC-R1]|uniref:UDP-N-acetylmuramoyl-tripeptide--D-alanyl-D- alanine ligase n=1 Tax=Bacillus sp. S/N-304-OC-R1 TaxID=2758034 RepID=UPI001C8E0E32|nr:UDP-N-acetylmuramoyl-tripeptide--D-alanyl-D-alanine ligase [Bacillus sp. S/N-304-OC-R1]MBY0121178.1 UDP-N-acetylmuramoyl-tripeptide--D-alanyl-D-alanine ligase [Bacillus sp. S/N-304-OC-R1]